MDPTDPYNVVIINPQKPRFQPLAKTTRRIKRSGINVITRNGINDTNIPKPFGGLQIQQIKELYSWNYTDIQISEMLGIDIDRVRLYMK